MAALAHAQGDAPPAPGDWIVGDLNAAAGTGGAYAINPLTGAVNNVAVGRPTGFFNWVIMAGNNRDLAAAWSVTHRFALVTPAGVITSGFSGFHTPNGLDHDQDGTYLASAAAGTDLYRISPDGMIGTFLAAVPPPPIVLNNVCLDHDTGDYVLAMFSNTVGLSGTLLRSNRLTPTTFTTIAAFPNPGALTGRLSSVDHCQQDGNFYVTRFDAGEVLQVTPGGVVTTVHDAATSPAGFWGANGVKCDDETGNLLIAGLASNAMLPARVGVMTRTGTIVTQYIVASPAGFNPTSAELYGSRKVSGLGNFAAGSVYTVNFSFPASSGFSYVAAMSLGLRPAVITLPDGRSVNLAFDPLLVLSVGGIPGITTGFSGVLDANGRATGTITLPAGFPRGVRLFIGAVAVNPSFPSGLDTANSLGATSN
jgi:hypothetical protein